MTSPPRSLSIAALVLFACAANAAAEPTPKFPVPRAEQEFSELVPFVIGWGSENSGDRELFRRWVLPYAPLDLRAAKATPAEEEILRNTYLGVAGAAFEVDSASLANSFHCGADCIDYRRSDVRKKLPAIAALATALRAQAGVVVLAQWGTPDEFRVNELFRIGGQQRKTRESAQMGFLPSASWTELPGADAYIAALGAKPAAVRDLLARMREQDLAALVREPSGLVRAVRVGISDNEAGVAFTPSASAPFAVGDRLPGGGEVVVVEPFGVAAFYYETN